MEGWRSAADWLVALVTLGALIVAVLQMRVNRRAADEAFARQMWTDYLKLGLQNPELGESWIAIRELKLKNASNLVSGESMGSQRYLWFLTVILDACESVLVFFPSEQWRVTLLHQLTMHKDALALVWKGQPDPWRESYGKELDRLVEEVLARA